MAMTEEQRRIVDFYLAARTGDELAPPAATISITKRQLAFVLAAIDHYATTKCPLEREDGRVVGCDLLEWYEDPSSGAVALGCFASCTAWRDALIRDVVPHAFGAVGAPPVVRPARRAAPLICPEDVIAALIPVD